MKMRYRACLLFSIFSLSGCLESSFELSAESRLPKWFSIPDGVSRSDYTVLMDMYSTFTGGKIVIELRKTGTFWSIEQYTVDTGEQPSIRTIRPTAPKAGFPEGYPRYIVITINGVTDIIELRKMEPIFFMANYPTMTDKS